jgi:hypothetical protein
MGSLLLAIRIGVEAHCETGLFMKEGREERNASVAGEINRAGASWNML